VPSNALAGQSEFFGGSMRRRDFIGLVASAPAWPPAARAQQPERMRRIGILIPQSRNAQGETELAAFRSALHELGWTEGSTVTFQIIWAGGDLNQIKNHAKELVAGPRNSRRLSKDVDPATP
jgi:putative tryptophan/tyrosine transport system substrate-binding protein